MKNTAKTKMPAINKSILFSNATIVIKKLDVNVKKR